MATDLEIIKELEKEIGKEIEEIKDKDDFDIHSISHTIWGYILDETMNVIGLRFDNKSEKQKTKLKSFPISITRLKHLQKLSIYNQDLEELPDRIIELSDLEDLCLGNNKFTLFPNAVFGLKKLRYLLFGNNKIVELPDQIFELSNLEILALFSNRLTTFPEGVIGLNKLSFINLGNNKIKELPDRIIELSNLEHLDLRSNRFRIFPKAVFGLKKLSYLDLRSNQIKELPKKITELRAKIVTTNEHVFRGRESSEAIIDLYNNPIQSPPLEIIEKGRNAIIEYFRSVEAEEYLPLNEVKLLLVGDGGVGKTSLVKMMLGESFDKDEKQTKGINITDIDEIKVRSWNLTKDDRNIEVHIWDFGGQELMHATHQFFLSRRSLYILVVDSRKDEKVEYWLKHIESFGGDSPVLVVINKIDENPSFDVNRSFLMSKYKGIKGFYRVSCRENRGVEDFMNGLSEAINDVELISTKWPKKWFDVKEKLESMGEHFITYDKYKSLCDDEKITEETSQNVLVDFLHDLGIVLHFREFELEDTHVLNPKWVTEAVYRIINSEILSECKGLLRLGSLKEILKKKNDKDYDYPTSQYKYIIGLMKKFELCYEIDGNIVLIPDLLDVQEPQFDFNYDSSLRFVIEYDFLPRSILPRFIVKMNKNIKGELRWRTGVVLEDINFGSTAVIRADNEAKKIYIYVNGEQRRDFLATILYFFREINNSFEKLAFIEKVPMPDNPDVTVSYKHLLTLANKKVDEYIPDGSDKEYSVSELLGIVQFDKKPDDMIMEILTRIEDKVTDKDSFMRVAGKVIQLKPNFMGVGLNLNELWERFLDRKEKRKKH
jgi:internalin A